MTRSEAEARLKSSAQIAVRTWNDAVSVGTRVRHYVKPDTSHAIEDVVTCTAFVAPSGKASVMLQKTRGYVPIAQLEVI